MATPIEFKAAFESEANIVVSTASGKKYRVNRDQLPSINDGGLIYGVPVKKHIRATNDVVWFEPKNVVIV